MQSRSVQKEIAGIAMVVFEIEAVYNHIKGIFVKEEK